MSELHDELETAIGKKWTKRLLIMAGAVFAWAIISMALSIWPSNIPGDVPR